MPSFPSVSKITELSPKAGRIEEAGGEGHEAREEAGRLVEDYADAERVSRVAALRSVAVPIATR